ncbi:MAG: hypothetical protein VYA34_14190 [Myxococcota bacterium]|nr:hypothetical protein [Myxococcota bacterium]
MSDYLAGVVDDALLELLLDDLQINISALLGDAQTRIASLYADIRIPFTAVRDTSNGGVLQLRQVPKITISNTHQVYNEIAQAADLTQFFETLVDLAITVALKDSLNFDLDFSDAISSALGSDALTLKIADIRRDVANFQHAFLSIYVTLCSNVDTNDPNHVICYQAPAGSATNRVTTTANMESMYEKISFKAKNGALHRRTTGRLEVPIEDGIYQYRVDGGAWRSQLRIDDATLTVQHPFLRVPGDHLVEIARINDRGHEAWRTNIPVRIDPFPPTLTHTIKGSTVQFAGTDDIQPNSVYFVKRFVDSAGTQTPWSPTPDKFELDSVDTDFINVEFAAVDATGNQSPPLKFALNKEPPNTAIKFNSTHDSVSKSSCHQIPLSLWLVLLMIPWIVCLRPKPKLNG